MSLLAVALYVLAGLLLMAVLLLAVLAIARYRRRVKFRRGPLKPLERRLLDVLIEHSHPDVAERIRR